MPSLETAQARGAVEPVVRRAPRPAPTVDSAPPGERGGERGRGQRKVTGASGSTDAWGARASRRGFGGATIENTETS